MTHSDSWKIYSKPWGITSQQNEVYVVCCDDLLYYLSVIILDLSGVHLREIPLINRIGLLGCGGHIAVSNDTEHLYITDYVRNSVLCITLQGLETSEYSHKEFQEPEGLLLLDDGSLLVSNNESGNIHYISADLKLGYKLQRVTCKAISVCYNPHNKEVYFGCTSDPIVKVFSLRKEESS
jgi:DNA-binding beta-propeller fold protein YncE